MKSASDCDFIAMLGAVYLHMGVIDMETEELTSSEEILTEALNLLEPKSMEPEIVLILLNVYNNLGILWSNRDKNESEKAKFYLLKAKKLYEDFKCTLQMPIPAEAIFSDSDRNIDSHLMLEKAHTLTLYYLAQIFGVLKQNVKSAIYCHITLKRQLQYCDYDSIDWALNAATLSQFFAEQNGFVQSRHHLAAASTILDKYEQELMSSNEINTELYDSKIETYKHRSADVARCWVKYCLQLLSSSKNRLMVDSEKLDIAITDLTKLSIADHEDINSSDMGNLAFTDIDVSKYEITITEKFLSTFEDARAVFLCCQSWINKAKEYYKLDSLASDYIEIVQDNSQAYSYLAFFEDNDERQCKMHKRRINMLEELLKEVNPTYYIQYCRQLWYELGEVYSEILNIKLEKMNKSMDKPTPHVLNKINSLCEKSIENYERFITSIKNNGKLPEKLDYDVIRPVVTAYCIIARNNMKKITPDKKNQLDNTIKSLESYKIVVDICKKDENAACLMQEEYSLCQEMVNILPIKIKKIETQLINT
ncbi:KIF1-binding protein [Eumeta japonica]|uniref:KIF-binding protein n=1 Tax=Eumeta variegata TaxID=151549 RepID=A0A4C1YGT0_EUMVA|nr:KIF1-binding protein [Eumeta japonica]